MFFVRGAEVVPCPCCQGALVVIGSRSRTWIRSSGEKAKLIIRRLRCQNCRRIHHELPDLLVPYRRYESASMEHAIEDSAATDVAADESTLYRWRQWFVDWVTYAAGCLGSIARRFQGSVLDLSSPTHSALQRIGQFVGNAPGWLARVVRPIANLHLWIHTRSAFLSRRLGFTFISNPME